MSVFFLQSQTFFVRRVLICRQYIVSALCEIMIIHLLLLFSIIGRVEPGRDQKHAATQRIRGTIEPRGTKRRGKREEIEDAQRKS